MMGFLFIIATDETKSEKLMDQNYLKNEIVLLDFSILPESHDFPFQTKNKYLSFILSITYGLRLNIKQWSSLFPQFDTWYVLFKQIIWSLLLYSLILGQEGLGILQCHLGLKRSSTSEPQATPPGAPIRSLALHHSKTSPISLPPNNSWSTKWHWANKAPFQKRLQLQQETLWLWVCLKRYQYHDHSCGSTKPSLITVPWLHIQFCINLLKDKKKKKQITVENRGVTCLTRSTCNDKAISFSTLITHLRTD